MRRAALDGLPRLGWGSEATPVDALRALAEDLGLGWLGLKREDLLANRYGGAAVRALAFLLVARQLERVERWSSCGAVGSGHIATLTAAARHMGRRLRGLFEPLGPWVEENLASTASGPAEVCRFRSRLALGLRPPGGRCARRDRFGPDRRAAGTLDRCDGPARRARARRAGERAGARRAAEG